MSARRILIAGAVSVAALGAPTASAVPLNGAAQPMANTKAAETVQVARMFWDGDWYCFYWDGWNGPGWYLCDYGWNYGYGWGGHPGWRGWRVPRRPHGFVPRRAPVIKGPPPRVRTYRAPPVKSWGGGGGGAAPRKAPGGTIHRGPSGPGPVRGPGGGGGGGGYN